MPSRPPTAAEPPAPAAFYAVNRGGGLYSEAVSQRLGALLAWLGYRLGLIPTAVTAANLALGLAASAVVVALAPALARGNVPAWPVGLGALLAWQVSYALDCADGQLARVTGRATAAGARLDVLGDVAVQAALVAAVAAVAAAYRPGTPAWLLAAFGATWMVNPVAAVLQSGPRAASLVPSPARPVRLLKMVRDYGAVILALGLLLTFAPQWMVVAVWFFTVVNAGFLFASIGAAARTSAQRNGPDQTTER